MFVYAIRFYLLNSHLIGWLAERKILCTILIICSFRQLPMRPTKTEINHKSHRNSRKRRVKASWIGFSARINETTLNLTFTPYSNQYEKQESQTENRMVFGVLCVYVITQYAHIFGLHSTVIWDSSIRICIKYTLRRIISRFREIHVLLFFSLLFCHSITSFLF